MSVDVSKIRAEILEAVRETLERQVEILTFIHEIIDKLEEESTPDLETIAFLKAQALILVGREN